MAGKVITAFESRSDLDDYGDDALLLFALQLRWGITDIEGVAAEALTDAANDKKCDLLFVDRDAGRVVMGQGYLSKKERRAAPEQKASDLNTAAAWVFSGELDGLPDVLKSAAAEVRDAVAEDVIREVHIWYCHNAPESENVRRELEQAARTADSLIKRYFEDAEIEVSGLEVGLETLEGWYERTEAAIAVTDTVELTVGGGFQADNGEWSAYTTSVPGTWLREQWETHKGDLMAPNVRDYLGVVRSERNINNGIKTTAAEEPGRFWIYNNGITVLVHDFEVGEPDEDGAIPLKIRGLGIVNGGQTTGSLATMDDIEAPDLDKTRVLTRFVKCSDPDVLAEIIKFNNTQNKIEAADFRSKDAIQDKLREEFETVPDADYRGARRGGVKDAITRSANRLPDSAVAKALAAFQLEPNLAYNDTRKIWEQNEIYSQFFSDRLTARHVVFCFSLQRALEQAKKKVSDIEEGKRTTAQERHMEFFRRRGSISLMVAAISDSIETFLGRPVPDRTALRFKKNLSPQAAADAWTSIVDSALPFSGQLLEATDLGLKNAENVAAAMEKFRSMVEATGEANRKGYEAFAALVEVVD